jgi:hypothetical protein
MRCPVWRSRTRLSRSLTKTMTLVAHEVFSKSNVVGARLRHVAPIHDLENAPKYQRLGLGRPVWPPQPHLHRPRDPEGRSGVKSEVQRGSVFNRVDRPLTIGRIRVACT